MAEEAARLREYCLTIAGRGSVQIMGIDFGGFAGLVAQTNLLLSRLIEANANSGIGIGLHINHVLAELREA
jgi:hypothetical protein